MKRNYLKRSIFSSIEVFHRTVPAVASKVILTSALSSLG